MVKKIQKSKSSPSTGTPLSSSVKDSAQQIWQAGLGAFTRAQAEGSEAFEALVKEGVSIQRKTQAAARRKDQRSHRQNVHHGQRHHQQSHRSVGQIGKHL